MMVGPQRKTFLGLTLLLLAYSVAGAAISGADCGENERLKDGICQKCPKCDPGYSYPDDQDCGNGKGANITCVPCPDGKYRDWQDSDFRCKTCLNCSQYNKAVRYECRPEINAKCGECLPGFEEYPMSESFLVMPCVPCTDYSTSEACQTWANEEAERKLAEEKKMEDKKKAEELKEQWKKTGENLQQLQEENNSLQEENKRADAKLITERTKNAAVIISLGVLSGVLFIALVFMSIRCCIYRNGKWSGRAGTRNRAESTDRTNGVGDPELGTVAFRDNQITSPLIGNGVHQPRKQTEPLQKALSIRGAEPQYQLEEGDEPPNVPSFPTASTASTDTDIEDTPQTADRNALDSVSTCATPPQPFSAPNSGYFSMSGISSVGGCSQASTALVQDTPDNTVYNLASNFARSDLAECETGSNHSVAGAAPLGQPPIDPAPPVQTVVPCGDGQQTLAKTAPYGGARPKQRPRAQESDEQAADRRTYEEALTAAGRGKVLDLTEDQRLGLGLKLTPPSSHEPGIPHFHQVACHLGIQYEVYKSWTNGTSLVAWMCNQDTHLREIMRILNNVGMMAARNYVAGLILSRAAEDGAPAEDDAPAEDAPAEDAPAEDTPAEVDTPVRPLSIHDHPDCGIAQDDVSNTPRDSEWNVGNTSQPNIPILVEPHPAPPPLDNVSQDNLDDIEGAAAPAPAQESKGDLCYPVSETSRGSQPLTPPANERMHPFRVR